MGRYFSGELSHFVGHGRPLEHEANFATLKSILSDSYIRHRHTGGGETSVAIDWSKSLDTEELLVASVVCFCDIPSEHLALHTAKYGAFGLSFDKPIMIRYGARPVTYVPLTNDPLSSAHGRFWLRDVEQIYRGFKEHLLDNVDRSLPSRRTVGERPASVETATRALDALLAKGFIAFLKPYDSTLPDDDEKNYYAEREWRRFGKHRFAVEDVRRVFVAPGYADRMKADRPKYASVVEEITC